jgi:7,8-dihydroneopterin aldolase/epimerase/oxygenase
LQKWGGISVVAKSALDRIALVGIKLRPRLGVTPEERRTPQSCIADVSIWGDFEAAASTDDLAAALDYSKVLAKVVEVAHQHEYNLLETLAYRLGRAVLQGFPAQRVSVKIHKQPAVLADQLDHVEVEVEQA